jgi:chaperonin GroEL (HSP60 family)
VQSTVKSTLGPYGGDLLLVDENGRQTITNDGATVMKVRIYIATDPTWSKNFLIKKEV